MSRRLVALTAFVSITALITVRLGSQQPAPAAADFVEVPRPTGPYPVGTMSWHVVDGQRLETLADPLEKRQVDVMAWYPAIDGAKGERAPYLRSGLAEPRTFAALIRQPEGALDYLANVRTWSTVDAEPRGGERFPVLVFSQGYTGLPSSYTALLEDLASHGFAVIDVGHPYESAAATLSDHRVVTMLDEKKQFRKGIMAVLGEWEREGDTMTAVTKAATPDEKRQLMTGYLKTLVQTTEMLKRWVADTRLVVDGLAVQPAPAARLVARLDLGRLGAFGHSMGGVTSWQFCLDERRCRAGLNLDGIPQYGANPDTPLGKPFMMVYSSRPGRLGASDIIYASAAKPYISVAVAGTLHLDFSDMILWGGPLKGRPFFGSIAPTRAVEATRQIVREYFDQTLRGRPSPLLTGKTTAPDVEVRPTPPVR
jgi:predicted dienelactone hydrolase